MSPAQSPPTLWPDPRGRTPPPLRTAWLVEDKEDKEELMNKEEIWCLNATHNVEAQQFI